MHTSQPPARDLRIFEAYAEGNSTQADLGKRFKVSQQRVSQIIADVEEHLAKQISGRLFAMRATHTRRLENLYRRALLSFEKSQEGDQPGSPAFLSQARGILQDLRAVWGIDKSAPIDPNAEEEIDEWSLIGGTSLYERHALVAFRDALVERRLNGDETTRENVTDRVNERLNGEAAN